MPQKATEIEDAEGYVKWAGTGGCTGTGTVWSRLFDLASPDESDPGSTEPEAA
jgi:hypothetical protein